MEIKMYALQSKYGIVKNVAVDVKNWLIEIFVKMIIYQILLLVIVNVIRHVKLVSILVLEIGSVKSIQYAKTRY